MDCKELVLPVFWSINIERVEHPVCRFPQDLYNGMSSWFHICAATESMGKNTNHRIWVDLERSTACAQKNQTSIEHISRFSPSDRFLIIRRSRLFAGSFHDGWKGFDIYWGPNWIQVKSGHVWKREKKHPETNSESKAHTNWWVPRWISFWDGTSLTFLAKWRISDLCFTLEIWLNVFFLQLFVRGIYFEALMRQNEPSVKSVWKCQFKLYRYPGTRPEKIWLNQTNIYPPQN